MYRRVVAIALLAIPSTVRAQALAAVCRPLEHPTVGGWAQYQLRMAAGDTTEMRLAIVGRDSVAGVSHLWQESVLQAPAGPTVIQSLVPADPYDPTSIRRAVVQMPGRPPVELSADALALLKQAGGGQGHGGLDACRHGEALGWETITVPAGTFRALRVRYVREGRTADTWLAPGVPFALVRSTIESPADSGQVTLVLVAHGTHAQPTLPLHDPAHQ